MRAAHILFPLGLWMAVGGCNVQSSQLPDPSGAIGPEVLEPAPSRKTTSERIARRNLDASIDALGRRFATRPDVQNGAVLVDHLLLRADHYGTFDDWDQALSVARAALELEPENARAILLHTRVLNRVHEFDAALQLIDEARTSSDALASSPELEAEARHLELTVRLAQGDPANDIATRRQALATGFPSFQNLTGLALAWASHGRFEEADAAFRLALEGYRDVSPFPFAWVAFQRGVMWSEQADRPDLGRGLYEEALHYLPGYVLANVHLAELDAQEGDVAAAIARVERLISSTQDPEPLALLAALEPSELRAREYGARADALYRELLSRFPNAFAHHIEEESAR
ncbi:MAG: tetratricopeptide repeat protein [Polyangiales bacterium]